MFPTFMSDLFLLYWQRGFKNGNGYQPQERNFGMGLMHVFVYTETPSYVKSECKFPGFLGFQRGWSKWSRVAIGVCWGGWKFLQWCIPAGFSADSAGTWGNWVQLNVQGRSGKLKSSGQSVSAALVWRPPLSLSCPLLLSIVAYFLKLNVQLKS